MTHVSARSRISPLSWVSWAVLITAPFWLLGVISLIIGQNAFAANPVWADEVTNWRTLFSWDQAGLHTGANGAFELSALWGRLGTSGIAPILLYGWLVKPFGLSVHTILLGNALWLSLSALVFCAVRRPRPAVALSFTGLMTLYSPILLYCTTSMTELTGYALMLLYMTFLFSYHEKRRPLSLVLCILTMIVGCFYHPLFALLVVPAVLVISRFGWNKTLAVCIPSAIVLAVGCLWVRKNTCAPLASSFTYHLSNVENFSVWLQMVLSHGKMNLMDFFSGSGTLIELLFFALYLLTALVCLLVACLPLGKRNKGFRKNHLGCFLVLLAALGLTCAFDEIRDWRGLRALAPFLWLVLGYLTIRRRVVVSTGALVLSAAMAVVLLVTPSVGAYQDTNRYQPISDDPALSRALQMIQYDQTATDPFANTVRTDASYQMQFARELNPAIGVQSGWFSTDTTGRSRWILTDQLKCVLNGYECVADTDGYKVYRLIEKN